MFLIETKSMIYCFYMEFSSKKCGKPAYDIAQLGDRIGYYIVEYEQDGSDRAQYGSHLLKNLEKEINQKGMNYTLFKTCRQFYKVYPQIGSTVSTEFELSDFEKSPTVSDRFATDPDVLVNNLSFSHIREIMVLMIRLRDFFMKPNV